MRSAVATAEKLNIQPTERSISRMASRNTMPIASMPRKVVWPRRVRRLSGLRNRGRATPMKAIMTDQGDDHAELVRQPQDRFRGVAATGADGRLSGVPRSLICSVLSKASCVLKPGVAAGGDGRRHSSGVDQVQQLAASISAPFSSPAMRPR